MTDLQDVITQCPDIVGIERGSRDRITNQMELFQRGIIVAIASSAGFGYAIPQWDDGIDIQIKNSSNNTCDIPLSIDIQLKSTRSGFDKNGYIHSRMTAKRYNEYRIERRLEPRIVVIMDLPEKREDWYKIQADGSSLVRNCCYWTSLAGASGIPDEQQSVDIKARRDHPFDDATLCMLMAKTRQGIRL